MSGGNRPGQSGRILVVDDDPIIRDSLREFLTLEGWKNDAAENIHAAQVALASRSYSIVIIDVNLPDGDGLTLLEPIQQAHRDTVVLVMTAYGSIPSAVRAIKRGAFDYLTKPVSDGQLRFQIESAHRQLQRRVPAPPQPDGGPQKFGFHTLLSQDPRMKRILKLVGSVADTDTTILMTGPSGTGKSMLARAIHHGSRRRNAPFIDVSCGALPETLLESELFGHVRGAFTGAVNNKEGKFLAAGDGTILLDEIGTASPALQLKLLRLLEEREFEPIGSNQTQRVHARILLATNCDLTREVAEGRFREDLFYRIHVVTVEMPPLRARPGDIPLLARHFLEVFAERHGRNVLSISEPAQRLLQAYHWPGNIRELENMMERATLLSRGPRLKPIDLPQAVRQGAGHRQDPPKSLRSARAAPEKRLIRETLEAQHWNRTRTAKVLEINRTTLYKKMKRYGLDKEAQELGF